MNEVKTLRSAFFVQMDNSILGLSISLSQKVICGAISGLSKDEGYCYISNDSLAKLLYVTPRSVETHISRLIKMGLVKNIGKKYDRRLIFVSPFSTEKTKSNPQNEGSNPQNEGSNPQNEGYVYIIYKYNIKEGQPNNQTIGSKSFYDLTFEYFWKLFPKRVKKQDAKQLFSKLTPNEVDVLLETLPAVVAYHDRSQHSETTFIPDCPHPTTFLRGKRWEDEVYLSKKISKKEVGASVSSELDGCLRRFKALSDADDVVLSDVDETVLNALGMSEDEAANILNVDGMEVFKSKVMEVWDDV